MQSKTRKGNTLICYRKPPSHRPIGRPAVAIFLPLNCTRPRINANYGCVEFYVFFACFFGGRNVQAALLAMGRAS
jgi:hypothetical protein